MPSSISSSEQRAPSVGSMVKNEDGRDYGRPLPAAVLGRAAWTGVIVFLLLLSGWEMHWRSKDVLPSFRNSEGLWAIQRRRINQGEGDAVVFSGSSRVLFDLNLDVWEQESGQRPIQLALEGTSPMSLVEDLAGNPDFSGTLIVGVSPKLFFSGFEFRRGVFQRYLDESPSQWLGQRLSMLVEPYLAFYNFDFALFTVLKRQPWPERPGVPDDLDVRKLSNMEKDRNTRMWSKLENNIEYRDLARFIWAQNFKPIEERSEEELERFAKNQAEQLERAIAAVEILQARGVRVIFLRNPSEGYYAISEPMYHPREETWDVLIEQTGAIGIHWEDHEELQGYWLPEWSHLSSSEADRYTKALYHLMQRIMQEEAEL